LYKKKNAKLKEATEKAQKVYDEEKSIDKILEEVWGFDYIGNDNILDLYIKYLRDKIDRPYERKFIQTVRGIGFIFK